MYNITKAILDNGIENVCLKVNEEIVLGSNATWEAGEIVGLHQYLWDNNFRYKVCVKTKQSEEYKSTGHAFYVTDLQKFIDDNMFAIVIKK